MARIAFSIRFPVELAEALDQIAQRRGYSRSDLVETVIGVVDAEDREAIVKTTVVGAPTEKRNLRLSAAALDHLRQLAGDLEPSDFLRRALAHVVGIFPPGERQEAAPSGNSHGPGPRRTRRPQGRRGAVDEVELGAAHGAPIVLVVVPVLLAFGALVAFIVWLICRGLAPPSPGPGDDRRGQLPDGPAQAPGA